MVALSAWKESFSPSVEHMRACTRHKSDDMVADSALIKFMHCVDADVFCQVTGAAGYKELWEQVQQAGGLPNEAASIFD